MGWAQYIEQRERSRERLFSELDGGTDLTLVQGPGNIGDELICAGTHMLLGDRPFRTIDLQQLSVSRGQTAALVGSGAFTRAFHEWAPWALAVAELRFKQVIVLPSSFDTAVSEVSEALRRTRAVVFARERQSFEAIRGLCDARLAFDAAFYFDFGVPADPGSGVLSAFRTDREAPSHWPLPDDNRDISVTAGSLGEWLEEIARHAVVRTNRAHVMIAAALMGKQVELGPCASFKLEAIAAYALPHVSMARLAEPERPASRRTARAADNARVTMVAGANAADRQREIEQTNTEFVLLLDRDAELTAQALKRLVAELDRHPEAIAVAPCVVSNDGSVRHCGGEIREHDGLIEIPHAARLARTVAFADFPLDPEMGAFRADAEWAYRVGRGREGMLRRCPESRVQHSVPALEDDWRGEPLDFRSRCLALPALSAITHFYRRHGLVMADLSAILPGLMHADGSIDAGAAQLSLEVFEAFGPERFLMLWCGGQLGSIVRAGAAADALDQARAEAAELRTELERVAEQLSGLQSTRAWRLARSFYRLRNAGRR